jgi:competence protein ComGC
MKGEKSDPLKDRIAFQADLKADRLVVGTTPEVLATALASKGQLATDAAFSDAWRNMPTDGNFAAYVAPRFLTRIGNLATEAMKPDGKVDSQNKEVVGKLIDLLKPHMRRGHAIVIANQPDGIAMTWNTTVHYGSISAMPLYSIPTLAGFAMPVFQFAAQKVRETGELSKLRKLSAAVKEYIATNGKRPASLSDLKRAGLIDNNSLLEYNDTTKGVSKAWIYRDTLIGASTENAPLIVAPLSTNSGMRATAFTDGSVRMVSEAELARLVKPATGK